MNDRNWYTIKEFSELTGKSRSYLYKLGERGVLIIKNGIGGKIIPKSEYIRYLDNGLSDTIEQ
ncbi:MAG: helix-turn-helix domain-containing protein [Treponema sp.]|jgi:predicted DNA-binding transcriptional regulator AlpA|nr:helix-turn-helix domain-containing protein [Treponema sp.]